jgi:hypothetical protein
MYNSSLPWWHGLCRAGALGWRDLPWERYIFILDGKKDDWQGTNSMLERQHKTWIFAWVYLGECRLEWCRNVLGQKQFFWKLLVYCSLSLKVFGQLISSVPSLITFLFPRQESESWPDRSCTTCCSAKTKSIKTLPALSSILSCQT